MGMSLVGSDKPFTTIQAAIADLVLNHTPFTEDWEIVCNGGETFSQAGSNVEVMFFGGINTGAFRLTVRGQSNANRSILDGQNVNGIGVIGSSTARVTIKWFNTKNCNPSLPSFQGGFNLLRHVIFEQMEVVTNGGHYAFYAMEGVDFNTEPIIVRNCYIRPRVVSEGDVAFVSVLNFKAFGNTVRNYAGVLSSSVENAWKTMFKDNIYHTIVSNSSHRAIYVLSANTPTGLADNFSASNNLTFNIPVLQYAKLFHNVDPPTAYVTLADFQAVGKEANSFTADPLLTSFANPHLMAGSPAIGAGVAIAGLTEDMDGDVRLSSPAIGADEPFFAPPGTEATNVVVVDANTITCNMPAHASGLATINVANPDSQFGSLINGYTYNAAPTVNTPAPISPAYGPSVGGTAVTISGTGFQSGCFATVNGVNVQSLVFQSSTTLTGVMPPSPGGTTSDGLVNLFVQNPDGQGSNAPSNVFAYHAAPTVTVAFPATGINSGGTPVTLNGTHFHFGVIINSPTGFFQTFTTPTVSFGGTPATNVVVLNEGSLTCDAPLHAAGQVNVVVTNSDGQSGTLVNGYTYTFPAPNPQLVVPNTGDTAGGTSVTIYGNPGNFQSGCTVLFGSTPADNVVFGDGNTIFCDTPAQGVGPVNVRVTNPDTQFGTLVNGFTYVVTAIRGIRGWSPDPIILSTGQHKVHVDHQPLTGIQDLYVDNVFVATRIVVLKSTDDLSYRQEFTRAGTGNGVMHTDNIHMVREE